MLYHLVCPQVNSGPHFKMINRAQRLSNLPKDTTGSWYIVVFWLLMLFRILEIDKFRVGKASFYIQKLTIYVFLTIYLVFPRLGNLISAKILGCPSYNASCHVFCCPYLLCWFLALRPHAQLFLFIARSTGLQPHLSASSAVSPCLTGRQ